MTFIAGFFRPGSPHARTGAGHKPHPRPRPSKADKLPQTIVA
jgi:hypothetical protein